jgi:plasmid stabilization system protein ParE
VASNLAVVRITANFEANLAQIAAYWAERGAPRTYAKLIDELIDTVIGNLERHPRIGRSFFARSAQSAEVKERVAAIMKRFGAFDVREYLSGDYLLLYAITGRAGSGKGQAAIYLLSIKHHRQLSFDFEGFWQANRGKDA